ncbi:unnamed protein product [Phaedon cochleariae]|uniref:Ankyrin repeat and MYND domain-containing protein 1 n=1 Tax=Phaedon cochleariae TaxID=80249 RepID=A0A9P0DWG7_PHACE|nr:unnamed protein product [Phaedon cochleariae]
MAGTDKESETQTDDIRAASHENVTQTCKLSDNPQQSYIGKTLLNNLHGSGIYFLEKPNKKIYIDGLFYCNKLEGYGHVFYGDGSSFQGLFKDNRRFGPGVFTYPNGNQDVGIWNGFSLVRLSSPVHEFFLPKLAESARGLAQLLRYRDQLNNSPDELERIEGELEKIETILANLQKVKPALFEKIQYCKTCCYQPERIESRISSQKSGSDVPNSSFRFSNVDDLRSTMTETMTFDDTASYAISEGIISLPEEIEKIYQGTCVCDEEMGIEDLAFLEKQYEDLMEEELFYNNIRRGLSDRLTRHSLEIRHNSITQFETDEIKEVLAWNNEKLMIDILKHSFLHRKSENRLNVKLSAIFESQRFIEFSHRGHYELNCENFLAESGSGYFPKVMDHLRKPNVDVNVTDASGNNAVFFAAANHNRDIIRVLVNFGANLNQINDEGLTPLNMCILSYLAEQNKIEDWESAFLPEDSICLDEIEHLKWYPGISMNIKTGGTLKSSKRGSLTQTYFFNTKYREEDTTDSENEVASHGSKRDDLFKNYPGDSTIISLLNFGADPNIGHVPFPALALSLYTENHHLVEKILESGADTQVKTSDENLTCLHIMASIECSKQNVEICSVLLKYGCDPNVKTDEDHWREQNVRIMGNYVIPEEFEDTGKNPLHMLCLRKDFKKDSDNNFQNMAKLFIDSGIDINDTYLGLNALELAILSGNLKLVEFLLKTGLLDPHRLIDPCIGNTLTLFLSERFRDILPLDECKQMIELLVNFGVNPLYKVGDYENVIEFMERDDGNARSKKGEAPKKANETQITLKNLLKNLARKMILKDIGVKAVEYLYNLAEADLLDNEGVQVLAEYLTTEQFLENLKVIFEHGKIPIDRFDTMICQKVLDFVRKNRKQPKTSKKQKSKLQLTKSDLNNFNFDSLLDSIRIDLKHSRSNVNHEVCFQCLKSHEKTLTKCPKCELLYFCSIQCNKANLKQKNNEHVCALNVFEHTGEWVTDVVGLIELCKKAEYKNQMTYLERKRKQEDLRRKEEEDERRKDIYGYRNSHKAFVKSSKCPVSRNENCNRKKSDDRLQYEPSAISSKSGKASTLVTASNLSTSLSIALDEKLQRLSMVEKLAEKEKVNKKHKITQFSKRKIQKLDRPNCGSSACMVARNGKEIISRFEVLPNLEEPYITARKTTKKLPERTKFFIELLKNYFPNVDLSFLIVPYICYADGHLYYQFSDENQCENYSMT